MNRKKWIYIGVLIVVAAIVSIASFSYAFLTRVDEQHGKINIVAGTLDYKIESDNLSNNSITLSANESKEIEITIKSVNKINSKYQLYTNNVENVDIRYTDEEEPGVGTISSNGTKTVKVVLENNSDTDKTITFGVQGGFEDKTLTLEDNRVAVVLGERLCDVAPGTVYNFDYTGGVQEFTAKCSGTYKLETWGAQGYNYNSTYYGGYGGYSVGMTSLNSKDNLYIFVGEKGKGGKVGNTTMTYTSYPNGGNGLNSYNNMEVYIGSGGGSTHISMLNNTISEHTTSNLDKLVIVAGGGGSSIYYSGWAGTGGNGGGYNGSSGIRLITDSGNWQAGTGGTQSSGGTYTYTPNPNVQYNINGTFGHGGNAINELPGSGGGGGYYGGAASFGSSAGGGSGYIGNVLLKDKKMVCYNCTTSTAVNTYTVSNTCVNATATSDCSKTGNGYARITYIGD